jgi:hypothetical protein
MELQELKDRFLVKNRYLQLSLDEVVNYRVSIVLGESTTELRKTSASLSNRFTSEINDLSNFEKELQSNQHDLTREQAKSFNDLCTKWGRFLLGLDQLKEDIESGISFVDYNAQRRALQIEHNELSTKLMNVR